MMKESGSEPVAAEKEDSLKWRYQDKTYNERYKRWRRQNKGSFGFYYVENPTRMTYRERGGFITEYPEAMEAKIFRKVISMLGLILIFRAAADVFFMYIFPYLLIKMGYEVSYSIFSGRYYGSTMIKILTDTLMLLTDRALPTLIVVSRLKIPLSVAFPMKITNKPMFRFAIPAALLTAGVCSAMSFLHDGLMHIFNVDTTRSVMVPDSVSSLIYIFVTQIILIPVVSELFVHGGIFQLIRQFGDGIALIITSVIIASSSYDITQILNNMIMALTVGYFVLRTGSVLTGIIMRIFTTMFFYALSYLDYGVEGFFVVKVFLCGTILLGLIGAVYFFITDSDNFSMKIKKTYMPFEKKILTVVTSIPIIAWGTVSFLLMMWRLNFTA